MASAQDVGIGALRESMICEVTPFHVFLQHGCEFELWLWLYWLVLRSVRKPAWRKCLNFRHYTDV